MVSPVGYTYTCASGAGIYGGKYNRPAWRRAIAARNWAEVGGNTLSNVDPKLDEAVNPNYPLNAPWTATTGFSGLFAYSGGCYDQDRMVFHLPLQGGHQDYAGNEPYKFDMSVDVPMWVRIRNPSGAIGNLGTLNDGQEATGLYFDGRPRAIHSYNKPVYVPGVGPVISVQGNTSYAAAGPNRTLVINENTGEVDLFGATNSYANASSGGGACYDPSRHCVWFRGAATGFMSKYDIATDSWSSVGTSHGMSQYVAITYLPDHDCILIVSPAYTNRIAVFDCVTGVITQPSISGSYVGFTSLEGTAQPALIDGTNTVAVWNNSSDTTVINTLTFASNPRTDTWVVGQLSVSGGVTPTAKNSNGTYGRFFYSRKLDGFGLINATTQNMYFYARS